MNKSLKPSIFKTSLIAVLLTGAFNAQAAGLGKLSVYSGIGQQLNAEVALSATTAEMSAMSARLASPEAFREAGIEYMPFMSDVRIDLDKNAAGQPVLKLRTLHPISEPFLHFLVELSWTSGRLVREYTFLLDPPEMLQVAKPASVVAPVAPKSKSLPASQPTAPIKPAAASAAQPSAASGEYRVKQGDTLTKIARETRPESVTLDQMLVALFNGNPEAFAGSNMNRLMAGKILRVPSAEEVGNVDATEARKLVINHVGEFNAYRNRLAAAASGAPTEEAPPKQQAAGTIKPQVEDKTPVPAAKDKLEVSRTEPAPAAAAAGRSLEEDLFARDKALREASERIAMLEKNIENLKKLVEVKSQTGVKLQQESEATQPQPADKPAEPVKAETPVPPATAPVPVAATEPAPKPEEVKPAVPAEPVAAKPAEAVPPPAPKKPVAVPPPEPSFVAENPELVYGGGGLLVLLLGYLGYSSMRRKKKQAEAHLENVSAAPVAKDAGVQEAKTAPVPGAPAAGFDSGEISIQSEFSGGGLLSSEEIVDPVAEADVLMAYGRDRQAEEILLEGLNKDPARSAIHMKLLELYAKQENIAQFESVAKKLHALSNGRGADWEKTLADARTLGLTGGIFAGAGVLAGSAQPPADKLEPTVTIEPLPAESAVSPGASPFAEAPAASATPPDEEVAALDFDLDLGSSPGNDAMPAAGAAGATGVAEAASAKPAVEEDLSLDFDFDLGTPETREAVEAVVEKAEAATEPNLAEIDFDLDLGSPVEAATALPAEELETSSISGGIGDLKLDFDLELDQPSGAMAAPAPLAEATDLALEFPGEAVAPAELPASVKTPDNPEAATKLELAQAYEEMGDLEGARELLNEVVSEGSESQQAQARARLDQLSV